MKYMLIFLVLAGCATVSVPTQLSNACASFDRVSRALVPYIRLGVIKVQDAKTIQKVRVVVKPFCTERVADYKEALVQVNMALDRFIFMEMRIK